MPLQVLLSATLTTLNAQTAIKKIKTMQNSFSKRFFSGFGKKNTLFAALLIALGLILPLHLSLAFNPVKDTLDIVGGIIVDALVLSFALLPCILLFIIFFATSLLPAITGGLLQWIINLEVPLTRCPTTDPTCVINAGWMFTRDLANVAFILILIIIAFATILKIESYGMRKLLPTLIIIALLVNFSQLFVGIIVDIAQVFLNFFTAHLGGIDLLWNEVVQKGKMITDYFISGAVITFTGNLAFFAKMMIMIYFDLVLGFILGLYVLIFLLRIPMMWMLTILAPIYLAAAILPFTKSKFTWWLNQVLQWAFIGVWALFFLYLSVVLLQSLSPGAPFMGGIVGWGNLGSYIIGQDVTVVSFIQDLMPFVMVIAFLTLGIVTAFQTNALFANVIMKWGKGIYDKFLTPTAFTKKALGPVGKQIWDPLKGKLRGAGGKVGRTMRHIPIIGKTGTAAMLEEWGEHSDAMLKFERDISSLSSRTIMGNVMAGAYTGEQKVGAMKTIFERGDAGSDWMDSYGKKLYGKNQWNKMKQGNEEQAFEDLKNNKDYAEEMGELLNIAERGGGVIRNPILRGEPGHAVYSRYRQSQVSGEEAAQYASSHNLNAEEAKKQLIVDKFIKEKVRTSDFGHMAAESYFDKATVEGAAKHFGRGSVMAMVHNLPNAIEPFKQTFYKIWKDFEKTGVKAGKNAREEFQKMYSGYFEALKSRDVKAEGFTEPWNYKSLRETKGKQTTLMDTFEKKKGRKKFGRRIK